MRPQRMPVVRPIKELHCAAPSPQIRKRRIRSQAHGPDYLIGLVDFHPGLADPVLYSEKLTQNVCQTRFARPHVCTSTPGPIRADLLCGCNDEPGPAPSGLGLLDRAPGSLRIDLERSLTTGPDRFLHFSAQSLLQARTPHSWPISDHGDILVNHLRCGGQRRNGCELTSNEGFLIERSV